MNPKTYFVRLAIAVLSLFLVVPPARAVVIDFEDVTTPFLPMTYRGFNWTDTPSLNRWAVSTEAGNLFPGVEAHSQTHYAWNDGGVLAIYLFVGVFNVDGLWARMGNSTAGSVVVQGYGRTPIDLNLIFSRTLDLTNSYQFFTLNFTGITEFEIFQQVPNGIALVDDISITAVPEPVSSAVVAIGFAVLGLFRLKRRVDNEALA